MTPVSPRYTPRHTHANFQPSSGGMLKRRRQRCEKGSEDVDKDRIRGERERERERIECTPISTPCHGDLQPSSDGIILAPLPWSTITLFTSYPTILSVITKASSWGCVVLILSSSEKLSVSWISTLALFSSGLVSSADSRATDITLEGQEPVFPGAAKMTFIIPKGGLEGASLQGSEFAWPYRPLKWCKNCFNFPS